MSGIALVSAGALLVWWPGRDGTSLVYRGRPLRAWMQSAVIDEDPHADTILRLAIECEAGDGKARIREQLQKLVVGAVKTRDSRFWSPYNALKAKIPGPIAKMFPQWREPKKVRWAAALWISAQSGLSETPVTVLAECSRDDSSPKLRRMVSWGLAAYGLTSAEDFELMLSALTDPNPRTRAAAVRWFGVTKVRAETVVPLLVAGLEDNSMRSDYAEGLRAYGVQAMFMVPSLVELSKTNNPATASVASWALVAIDPQGTGKHFRDQGMR